MHRRSTGHIFIFLPVPCLRFIIMGRGLHLSAWSARTRHGILGSVEVLDIGPGRAYPLGSMIFYFSISIIIFLFTPQSVQRGAEGSRLDYYLYRSADPSGPFYFLYYLFLGFSEKIGGAKTQI